MSEGHDYQDREKKCQTPEKEGHDYHQQIPQSQEQAHKDHHDQASKSRSEASQAQEYAALSLKKEQQEGNHEYQALMTGSMQKDGEYAEINTLPSYRGGRAQKLNEEVALHYANIERPRNPVSYENVNFKGKRPVDYVNVELKRKNPIGVPAKKPKPKGVRA